MTFRNLSCYSTDIANITSNTTLGLRHCLAGTTERKNLKPKQNSLVCLYSIRVLKNKHGTCAEHGMGMSPTPCRTRYGNETMIMQRTETDLVSSNANLLVGLTHLNWWTAAEIQPSSSKHTHTSSSCKSVCTC